MKRPGSIAARDKVWRFDADDVLWCCRMVVGEGEHTREGAAIVTACMVRRLAIVGAWPSLTRLLIGSTSSRGYSQPIAHQWRTVGSPERLARRARVRSLNMSQIPAALKAGVMDVLGGGKLPGPDAAIHFADIPTTAASLARNADWREEQSRARNVMVSTENSRRYVAQNGPLRVIPAPCRLFS